MAVKNDVTRSLISSSKSRTFVCSDPSICWPFIADQGVLFGRWSQTLRREFLVRISSPAPFEYRNKIIFERVTYPGEMRLLLSHWVIFARGRQVKFRIFQFHFAVLIQNSDRFSKFHVLYSFRYSYISTFLLLLINKIGFWSPDTVNLIPLTLPITNGETIFGFASTILEFARR